MDAPALGNNRPITVITSHERRCRRGLWRRESRLNHAPTTPAELIPPGRRQDARTRTDRPGSGRSESVSAPADDDRKAAISQSPVCIEEEKIDKRSYCLL